ncbi:MAG: hypothetical protein NZ700_06450 [Gemmataceae bacterium]|nr:hypothetical protein [Gemmataceae bacterium]MDW8266558.1 hypothetical protein [Gemmataceae bacterium]
MGCWSRPRVVVYLVLGLVAIDWVVWRHRAVWKSFDPDDYQERLDNCRRHRPDTVVVGGSPVSEGIDPVVLAGLPWHGTVLQQAYNLGLPGATTSDIWHAVRHALRRPPKLLIYGITASDVNDDRLEPHGVSSLMDIQDLREWVVRWPGSCEWVMRQYVEGRLLGCWQLYRYRNGIRLWAAAEAERRWPGSFPAEAEEARRQRAYHAAMQAEHGFAPQPHFQRGNFAAYKASGGAPVPFGFLRKFRLGNHWKCLHLILEWAASHGVSVVLVDMPVTAELEEVRFRREFAAYRAALAELEAGRSVTVLRATREATGIGDADFADLIHLNARGTARLSAWIRQQLVRAESEPRSHGLQARATP